MICTKTKNWLLRYQKDLLSEKKIKISFNTISKYLSFFKEAYVIYHANRYDVKGSRSFSTPLKYYFADISLGNAGLNFRQAEERCSLRLISL